MRYAGSAISPASHVVPGYDAAECVLASKAAKALKEVQAELAAKQLSLKVYDCYRPARAVAPSSIGRKAGRSEGKVDLLSRRWKSATCSPTISRRAPAIRAVRRSISLSSGRTSSVIGRRLDGALACTAPGCGAITRHSIDMGTGFDCFDVKAQYRGVRPQRTGARTVRCCVDVMQRHGFKNYAKEWWHYTLDPQPYPDTIFDFPIVPREAKD